MPIKVNNVEITDDDVFREMQYQTDAPNVETVIFNAAQALVVQQLLLQEAKIDNSDKDQESKINQLLENNLRVPTADETACKRYYENNNKKFFDKSANRQLPFNLVQNHIKEYLQNQSTTSGINEYIQMLAANSEIKGFDFKDPSAMNVRIK
ncbi:hypothetical protein BROOK1789C_1622 [Bathymodiolus brooksi thiotrophic gill symbiont]|nr:hypothetical protein BROOK1789C_1622 [Bathymodiolus brooksi thiotrophic gill symbiont]